MATVWHKNKGKFDEIVENWPENYEVVATVESNDLGEIFYLTNTIDRPWWENARVNGKPARSTSVGDIVQIGNKFFVCEMIGWREVELAVP